MSANVQTETTGKVGRPAANPNITDAERMVVALERRTSKVLNDIDRLASTAVITHAGCKELGIDPAVVVQQVAEAVAGKFNKMVEQLRSGRAEKPSFSLNLGQ